MLKDGIARSVDEVSGRGRNHGRDLRHFLLRPFGLMVAP
jgi:hypothetical protein